MIINIAGGTGPMGRTHRPIFEAAGHEVLISGRKTSPTLEEAAQNSDLTIVSVPIPNTEAMIQRLAPYCEAMMDFTSLKVFPVNAMLKYSSRDCEVCGLHPLYGELSSIRGESVVYCPTSRSGSRCNQIVKSLMQAGAKVIIQTPEEHDFKMALTQIARIKLLETYALLLENSQVPINELYDLSPPPTRIILDLIARQANPDNDEMYREMCKYNPFAAGIEQKLQTILENLGNTPEEIRKLFGKELEPAQKRAKKLIDNQNT